MKVLITGISGLLGSEIAATLGEDHEIIGLTRTSTLPGVKVCNADLRDQSAVYSLVTKINPDVIMHSAAQSNVDGCEKDPDSAFRINSLGTRNLALACQRFDASMIYISTDYVFSGRNAPEKVYTEFDTPDPINVYARSKYEGERYVRELVNRFTVARVSWLFGPARSNFVVQAAEALNKGKEILMATDMMSSPGSVTDIARALKIIMEKQKYGTYHLCNSGFATRYEIGKRIAKIMKKDETLIKKVKVTALNLPAERPAFSGLRNYVWELENGAPLRPWQDAVYEFLQEQGYI